MHRTDATTTLSAATMAGSLIWAGAAGVLALASGGIFSGAILLLAISPIVTLILGDKGAFCLTALAGVTCLLLLAFMHMSDLVPPSLTLLSAISALVALSLMTITGFVFILMGLPATPANSPSHSVTSDVRLPQELAPMPLSDSGDLLILAVSEGGRVYRSWGARHFLPGLCTGCPESECVVDAAGQPIDTGLVHLTSGVTAYATRQKAGDGTLVILLRTDADADGDTVETLRRKLEQRTEFFAGLGHDLRSPLNAVVGFADLMDSEIAGPLPEAYREYPGLIKESGHYLLRLVEDMLGYARSEAGTYEIHPEPVDLAEITEEVLKASAATAERAEVQLTSETVGDSEVKADHDAVRRIIDNLVSNALKYSEPGGKVLVRLSRSDSAAEIDVIDNGSGLDDEDLARISAPFEQGRNAKGKAGTGLGLAMVKRLAEMHGGSVAFRSAPGEGMTVTVTLPAV